MGTTLDHEAPQTGGRPSAINKAKRKLLLRDGAIFLTLTFIALVLYLVTLFLFRSFEQHRKGVAIHWADRGRDELKHGRADRGATSLRNALSYDPDNRDYELLLAQALGDAGRTDQAMNYFLNLHDARPGDGFINLQLARLARSKQTPAEAVDYYHASIFGDWAGDAPVRRRSVRLELADYLTSLHQFPAARAELLIASGNSPSEINVNLAIGDKFGAIGDLADALASYKKAAAADPGSGSALEAMGRVSFRMGDYESARKYLGEALKLGIQQSGQKEEVAAMAAQAERFTELSFTRGLSSRQRTEHLFVAKSIAEPRLRDCSNRLGDRPAEQGPLRDLDSRWKIADKYSRRLVQQDDDLQDNLANLIGDSEVFAAKACGQPSGDDALLLKLATQ